MAAELRLGVSFDLVYFRQQLQKLSRIAASEFTGQVKLTIDKRNFQRQLASLSRELKINVNDSQLIGARYRLTNLNKGLATFRRAAAQPIVIKVKYEQEGATPAGMAAGSGTFKQRLTSLGRQDKAALQQLYRAAGQAGLVAFDEGIQNNAEKMARALNGVGEDAVKGLLNGLRSKNSELKTAAKGLGQDLITSIKAVLGIASPSKEFDKIGGNIGEGLQNGMLSSMNKAFDAAENLMRARMKVLDTIARGMFRIAGIDPSAVRSEMAQRRALPEVSFPATVPPRNFSIGPSSTGRALPPGAIPSALPGTAFSGQKYLPTALSEELKNILRGAAYAFVDSLKQQVRTVRIGFTARQQPLLSASRIAGALPAAVGRAPNVYSMGSIGGETRAEMMARREREARIRSALRGLDVMAGDGGAGRPPSPYSYAYRSARPTSALVPYAAGGAIVPQPAMAAGGGGGGGRGGFGNIGGFGFNRMPGNLPGQGTVNEMGQEFGFAAKQVLLFGTAYKALAMITGFPAQVGQAVASLQNFNNTLNAISPTAEEARASNQLILDLVDKYNVPLQSARDGFTKLYASMAPAGFNGDEIRNIFVGIGKAAATFGLSADKVDRVNYAFAQMASKGQVMSEELKGQLGDVLPGAMGIFAEAAGFKGTKAIQDFSAALEAGTYKGEAMKVLLTNVGVIMNKEFGPGAEGAARTFQGVMNRMQNSLTLLYESFEPVAVGFLNQIVVPLSNGIKVLSDGFTAFFQQTKANTSGGFAIAQELERLRPSLDGLRTNLIAVGQQFGQMAKLGLDAAKVLLQIAGNPFVGYLARVYAIVIPLNIALGVMRGVLASTAIQFLVFQARVATGTSVLTAFRTMMASTGATAAQTSAVLRGAFATTGIGLILVGLGLLIERFSSMAQKLDEVKAKAVGASQAIRSMSAVEARTEGQRIQTGIRELQGLQNTPSSRDLVLGNQRGLIPVSGAVAARLEAQGVTLTRDITGRTFVNRSLIPSKILQLQQQQTEVDYRIRQTRFEEQQQQTPAAIAPIPGGGGEGKSKPERERQLRDFQSEAVEQLRVNQRIAEQKLLQQRQLEIIDETEYEIRSAKNKRDFELLIIDQALAEKTADIGDYKAEVREKQLAVFNKLAENEKALAKDEYETSVRGARLKLAAPFKDALKSENLEIEKQTLLIDRAKNGFSELTAEQEANLIIEEKVKDLKASQQKIIEAEIEALRRRTIERIKGNQELQRELTLLGLRNQAAQLTAPLGQERLAELMQKPGYTPEQAQQQYSLEEQNRRLQVFKEGAQSLAGTINSSIGDALVNIATDFQNLQQHGLSFIQAMANAFKTLASTIIQEMTRAFVNKAVSSLFGFALNMMPSFAGGAPIGGSVQMPSGVGIGAGNGIIQNGAGQGFGTLGPNFGIRQFATGGVVTGPTMAMIGEGRFNEAVIPMPNGKSIPVDLGGGAGNNISTNIVVNMNNGQASSQVSGSGGQAFGREIEGAVRNVILKETRPGGIIYSAR